MTEQQQQQRLQQQQNHHEHQQQQNHHQHPQQQNHHEHQQQQNHHEHQQQQNHHEHQQQQNHHEHPQQQNHHEHQQQPQLLVLVGSPRRDGNSASLADAVRRGAAEGGAQVKLRFLDDYIAGFLRDCRTCRLPNGECGIEDRFRTLFLEDFLPAQGVVFCSPVYWYGLSAQTKAWFDRTFCYYAASYPDSEQVIRGMTGKRIGLALASEETYPGASLGIVHQVQEYARYTHSEFVGFVRGVGNRRGEVARDPGFPAADAERLGREFFARRYTDYRLDTPRSGSAWPQGD
ncbi:flavodoxin family protein [Cohnella nanjingensis]|uniref:Flavodoxin family protein n=1 Tax=Cohnella nanjingensis TaxID=1387779 RepID=A0A7X0RUC0_9BACL|nr:flavodoxin family protein [Cohnella nanjingensis]